jgi:hypothetical protein
MSLTCLYHRFLPWLQTDLARTIVRWYFEPRDTQLFCLKDLDSGSGCPKSQPLIRPKSDLCNVWVGGG